MLLKKIVRSVIPARFRKDVYLWRRKLWALIEPNVRRRVVRDANHQVITGPFSGLKLGAILQDRDFDCPYVLGTFEKELHPYIEKACQIGMDMIINVGSAEGYYAVGLALRIPDAKVIAFEMDPVTRAKIPEVANLNCLDNRIKALGKCEPADLQQVLSPGKKSLVICDVEGYENELIDPHAVQGLRHAFILVEAHEGFVPGISDILRSRFQDTHRIDLIGQIPRTLEDTPYRSFYTFLFPSMFVERHICEPRMRQDRWLWMEPIA